MQEFLFFKAGRTYSKIKLSDILYIQADKSHITIITENKCYFSTISIGQIEKLLPTEVFRRIHRSYIISLLNTDSFDNELAYIRNKKIPIAEQYKNVLKNAIIVIHGNSEPFSLRNSEIDELFHHLNS